MSFGRVVASAIGACVFFCVSAEAAVFHFGDAGFPAGVTTTPSTWTDAAYSNQSNVDIGNQSPANVEAVLETAAWFGVELDFVGGGACGASPSYSNNCTAYDLGGGNSNKGGISNLTAAVFGVHFGNNFIAFFFDTPVSVFEVFGLRNGVSNIYAFNAVDQREVPLPAALWLMGAGLAGLGFAGRGRKQA